MMVLSLDLIMYGVNSFSPNGKLKMLMQPYQIECMQTILEIQIVNISLYVFFRCYLCFNK